MQCFVCPDREVPAPTQYNINIACNIAHNGNVACNKVAVCVHLYCFSIILLWKCTRCCTQQFWGGHIHSAALKLCSMLYMMHIMCLRNASVNSSCTHPPGQLRGICAYCQSRVLGITLPQGCLRAFDTHVVSDSKNK